MEIMLQWSRRLSTAETGRTRARHLAVYLRASMEPPSFDGGNAVPQGPFCWCRRASMEPPSFDGGNVLSTLESFANKVMLQWSRRLSTAETSAHRGKTSTSTLLQWSRRLSTAETLWVSSGLSWRSGRLQWSRRLSTAETLLPADLCCRTEGNLRFPLLYRVKFATLTCWPSLSLLFCS